MRKERAEKLAWIEALIAENGEGCRDWPWALSPKGYARLRWDGQARRAGHVILELAGHPRPSLEHHQLHSCDRPSCVAPWHIRWGTNLENRRESIERGRHAHRLTDSQVREIRSAEGVRQRDLADEFGVTQRVIWGIRNNKTWRHVA